MTLLTKGLWLSLWQTQDVSLLGSGLTILKFYTLGRLLKFIDSVKYYQQPLAKLARSTDANEKKRIRSLFLDYLTYAHLYYSRFVLDLGEKNIEFALEYLSSGRWSFHYEVVMGFRSLTVTPENGDFWNIETFYSMLRDEGISQKEWEGCRKLLKVLKMRNLSDFNDISNIQVVFILDVILEYRWQKIKDETSFDPRCFTSVSSLGGTIERLKSKVILTYPRNVAVVDFMESVLSGGYSSVHTRLGFDTEMFTPK